MFSWDPKSRNLSDYLANFGKGFFRKRTDYLSAAELDEFKGRSYSNRAAMLEDLYEPS